MSIPTGLKGRYAYHFTLIDNLESIIENGLLCTNLKNSQEISHENIAEQGIQGRRSTMLVPCSGGKFVHDYVPFYFSKRTPMQLGVINKKNVDQPLLVYLAIPIEVIESKTGVVFSDASANTNVPPSFYNAESIQMLESLNWTAIDDKKWRCPSDEYRHQKMAELLLPDLVQVSEISHIVVWDDRIKNGVQKIFEDKGMQSPPIKLDSDHFYTTFYDSGKESIISGPRMLKHKVDNTVSEICSKLTGPKTYKNIQAALVAIAASFESVKELDDIDEYQNLSDEDSDIVQLSVFFNNIGKGSKSRWGEKGMTKADNNRAEKFLPVLERILKEDIGGLSKESVRKIVMLVVYADLISDIVEKGRDEKQLSVLIDNQNELNMFIAITKADMSTLNPSWRMLIEQAIEALKTRMIEELKPEAIC